MKKLIHVPLILCALILTTASNCKKDKPKDPVTINYTLGDCKNYMYFKAGTYWVYENDISHEIDSQWVDFSSISTYTQHGSEEYSKHITLNQESFWMQIKSNFVDGLGRVCRWDIYSGGQKVNAYPYPDRAYQFEKTKRDGVYTTINTVFYNPYTLCLKKNCDYYFDTLLTNYSLNNIVYDTVRVFRVNSDGVFQQSSTPVLDATSDYYYAKNVGLIRIFSKSYRILNQTVFNQNWNLIRKKIIR